MWELRTYKEREKRYLVGYWWKIEEKGILEDYVAWIHEALVRDNIQSLLNRVMQFCGLMHGG